MEYVVYLEANKNWETLAQGRSLPSLEEVEQQQWLSRLLLPRYSDRQDQQHNSELLLSDPTFCQNNTVKCLKMEIRAEIEMKVGLVMDEVAV